MGRRMVPDGAGRFTVHGDGDALVARGVSLMQAVELVHHGCRLCEADEDHTNDDARSAHSTPERASRPAFRNRRVLTDSGRPRRA
jgi:hypothetical protein